MKKIIFTIICFILFSSINAQRVYAGAPTCQYASSNSSPYCQYTGTVSRAYINNANAILVYFDTNMPVGEPQTVGFDSNVRSAAILVITPENEVFAKAFYATALTALAANKKVTIQMRGVYGGYLKMDRIWIVK